MLKIMTALENENINKELRKIKNIEIVSKDIQYKEGILEILEDNKNIDFIFINKNIEGEISFENLVKKIKEINNKIKIILVINRKEEKNKYINNKYYFKILYEKEMIENTVQNILNNQGKIFIEDKDIENNKKLLKDNKIIKKLRKKLLNIKLKKMKINNKIINKIKYLLNKKNIRKVNDNKNIKYYKKCIVIYTIGVNGIGKSSIIINLSKTLSYLNRKILIIDLDLINNSIHSILGVKKSQQENYKIKINKNLEIISPNVFDIDEKDIIDKINLLIIKNRKNYDYIFIDTNSYDSYLIDNMEKRYEIINNSDYILFISGCNLLEINKSVNLLDNYINKLNIKENKLKIIFNKYSKFSINIKLLKKFFNEIEIIGYLKDDEKYNCLINKNNKNFNRLKKIRNEYLKIVNLIDKI